MKTWIKGSLIGAGIGILIDILFLIGIGSLGGIIFRYDFISVSILSAAIKIGVCTPETCMVRFFLFVIEFFILGGIIGWIYSKIKNKNIPLQ